MQYITGNSPLKMIRLSSHSYDAMIELGIDTIAKLLEKPFYEILKVSNIGSISITEIGKAIDDIRNGTNGTLVLGYSNDQQEEECKTSNQFYDSAGAYIKYRGEQTDKQEEKCKTFNNFYDATGILRKDIPIKDIGLSIRAYNCLYRSKIRYTSEIIHSTEEDLLSIRNMGVKTMREIMDKMKSINFEAVSSIDQSYKDNTSKIHEISTVVELEIKTHIETQTESLLSAINQSLAEYDVKYDIEINKPVIDYLNDNRLIRIIYSQSLIKNAIKKHIITTLQKELYGLTQAAFEAQLPNHLSDMDIATEILAEMQTCGDIIFTEHGVERRYITLTEFVRAVTNERAQTLLIGRLNGETLEELGQKYNVTRERVRQIVNTQLRRKPHIMEDRYIEVFKKYYFEKQDFMTAFDETEITYNYLNMVYSRGSNTIEALMEDTDFPLRFRRDAEKVVYKNYITVDGERIRLTRSDIAYYVIKTFFKSEGSFDDFLYTYMTFTKENNLDNDVKFMIDAGTYQNKLPDEDYVLWKQNKRIRYYAIAGYDFEELHQTLAFDQYYNIEYSALKFFREYPELMSTYDIHDEYELHNLLKKLYKDSETSNINFGRMPSIEFGTADRDMQVLELLLQHAPVSINDLANAYEKEYGVRSGTVQANYLKKLDEYFYNGMYTIDIDQLPAEKSKYMNLALTNDFYSIADIKCIYLSKMPGSDASNINPLTIKALGFKVFSNYAVRNTYITATEYFRKVLTGTDLVDLNELPKAMAQAISFTIELMELKSKYEIVEFTESKCINIRRLEMIGITKDDLRDYCNEIYLTIEQGSYFTIHSLQKNGLSHLIDKFGFKEWFYSSILSQDSKRFSYQRMGKTRVFVKGKEKVLLQDFIESIVSEQQSINIYDLTKLMRDDYGLHINKQKIMGLVNNSAMYYDTIMKTIHIDYATYIEKV